MASFDYVILGAGSAGCVLASRLSADPSVRVLVVEAGGSDASSLFRKPGMLAIVYQVPRLKKRADWGYKTTPQKHLDDRQMPWTRGKILGGCSTVNGMLYVRGNRRNYDDWAASGCDGWSYDEILPYFKKSETHEDGASAFHGGERSAPGHAPAGHQHGVERVRRRHRAVVRRAAHRGLQRRLAGGREHLPDDVPRPHAIERGGRLPPPCPRAPEPHAGVGGHRLGSRPGQGTRARRPVREERHDARGAGRA